MGKPSKVVSLPIKYTILKELRESLPGYCRVSVNDDMQNVDGQEVIQFVVHIDKYGKRVSVTCLKDSLGESTAGTAYTKVMQLINKFEYETSISKE